MDRQRLLTIVDTTEKLWLENSKNPYVQSQWKRDNWVEDSEIYQKNFLR